jgi:hypothetical protein
MTASARHGKRVVRHGSVPDVEVGGRPPVPTVHVAALRGDHDGHRPGAPFDRLVAELR